MKAANSFKTAVEFKHRPTWWHFKYRAMDDLCILIRTCRKIYEQYKYTEKWGEDFHENLVEAELSVVNELGKLIMQELNSGLRWDKARNFVRAGTDAFGMTPLSRGDHFIFGILDLIQQHAQTVEICQINDEIAQIVLKVAQESRYSFLRCKAFEVLATMTCKRDIALDVKDMVSRWAPELQIKATDQWFVIKQRVTDMQTMLRRLRGTSQALNVPHLNELY